MLTAGRCRALVTALLVGCFAGLSETADASAFRLSDPEGVTSYTNAPTDPRYKPVAGMVGTAVGWLRLTAGGRGRYLDEIREVAARHGVSPSLVQAVIRVESAFNPLALSPKGAQGLMQLMPRTASGLGVENAFDPKQNIEGGVRHLRYLMDRYPGRLHLALAAYNAGEGAVNSHGGVPPYAETQHYVRKVLELHGSERGGDPASAGAGAPPIASPAIYIYRDAGGILTFTNVPPSDRVRLRKNGPPR